LNNINKSRLNSKVILAYTLAQSGLYHVILTIKYMTTVVNIRKEPYDIYIGRAGKGQDGYFGNPFSKGTREQNINDYEKYFFNRLLTDPEFKDRILSLKDKVLGCFCKPLACHGDIIADYLDDLS